ncbi:MAG: BamA/TamA family outer membrane protein, partial [Acidobacteriota bacterium]
AMGADIVIAVDLGTPIAERGEMQSMVQIVSQTTGMITRSNVRLRLPDADLVLNPPVQEYGVMEFEQAAAIIQAGLVEARAHAEDLKAHAIAADDFAAHTAARPAPPPVPTTLEFVTFRGNERVDDRIIEARLDLQPGQPLDLTAIEANLGRLFGLGDFSAVEMALETRTADDGMIEHGVVLDLVEKDWGPNYLRGGLTLESGFEGEGLDFGLLVNLTMTHLNARAGEWRNDLRVGRQQLLLSELYQPLDFGGRFFVAPSLRLLQTRVGFFEDGVETSELDVEQDVAQVDFGFQGKHYGEIRIGVFRGLLDFEVGVGAADGGPAGSVDLGGLVFRARLDRLDNAAIPRRGTAFDLNILRSMSDLGGDDEYTKASLTASAFGSFGHHTIFGAVELGTSPDGMLPVYDQFFAGGILSFSGFQPNELTGQALGIGRLGYYRDIGQASFGVIDSVVAGGWVEVGNVWEEEDDFGEDLIVAGGVMLGADTAFGPMYLAYGRAETGDDQLYLSVGTTF